MSPSEVVKAAYSAANEGKYSEADGYFSSGALTAASTIRGVSKRTWLLKTGNRSIEKIEIMSTRVVKGVPDEGAEVAFRLIYKVLQAREDTEWLVMQKGLWKIYSRELSFEEFQARLTRKVGGKLEFRVMSIKEYVDHLGLPIANTDHEDANFIYMSFSVKEGIAQVTLDKPSWKAHKAQILRISLE